MVMVRRVAPSVRRKETGAALVVDMVAAIIDKPVASSL
jgi:hypothetical protein